MIRKKELAIGIAILLITLGIIWLRGFLAVDSCLDNGGRWNYESKECEFE